MGGARRKGCLYTCFGEQDVGIRVIEGESQGGRVKRGQRGSGIEVRKAWIIGILEVESTCEGSVGSSMLCC